MFGMSKIKFYVYTLSRACRTGEGKTKLIWVSMKLIKFTLHPRRILLVISFPRGSSSPLASASEKSAVIAWILSPLLKSSYCWLTEEKISLKLSHGLRHSVCLKDIVLRESLHEERECEMNYAYISNITVIPICICRS